MKYADLQRVFTLPACQQMSCSCTPNISYLNGVSTGAHASLAQLKGFLLSPFKGRVP
jgi:hypothetical protein